MAASEVEIVNRALALLGVSSITSLADQTESASTANLLWDDSRAATFRSHPWNCLTKRAALAKDINAPAWGFTNSFTLPADYLRLLTIEEPLLAYEIENGFIFSDDDSMNIKYTALVTDVTKYDVLLVDALAARLSADLCQPLLQSASAMEAMWKMYQDKLREARYVDAQENSQDVLEADTWIDARLGVPSPIDTPPRW